MSHSHGHGGPAPASRAVVVSLAVTMTLMFMATVFSLVLLWPSAADLPPHRSFLYEGAREVSGTVLSIESPGDVQTGRNAQIRVHLDDTGEEVDVQLGPTLVSADIVGARARLVEIPAYTPGVPVAPGGDSGVGTDSGTGVGSGVGDESGTDTGTGTGTGTTGEDGSTLGGTPATTDPGTAPDPGTTAAPSYMFMDFHRGVPLLALGIALAVLVVAVARLKGLAALCGLVAALATIWFFTLPALLAGQPSLPVALTTASAVLFIVVYLAHGISVKSSTALLGTFAGIALVTGLAAWAIPAAHLLPGASEEMSQLAFYAQKVDIRGVLLCGMVLSGVGVLNDVTITQASSVWELRAAAPEDSRWAVFVRAMRIGRDHIASTVYTIAFAYAGGALGLLMLASTLDHALVDLVTYDDIAQELVGIAVASIGLVLAIPLTTGIAAALVGSPRPAAVGHGGARGDGTWLGRGVGDIDEGDATSAGVASGDAVGLADGGEDTSHTGPRH